MRNHPLAPHVVVEYWRSCGRLMRVDHATHADFALLAIATPEGARRVSARFELPSQGETLATTLAAIDAAYTLGHHDRQNRIRAQMGMDRRDVDRFAPLVKIERGHDDRD